jgi:transposase InsO family protein
MLASLSAALVASFDPRWLAAPVRDLLPEGGPAPERLSRLKARLLEPLEELVRGAIRRGRPCRPAQPADERLVLRKLLALVPRDVWTYLRGEDRAALVEAQARLKREDGLPAQRFCELLGISERTFRDWKSKATAPRPTKPAPEPGATTRPKRTKKNLGRFDLEVTAPGVQAMADTSSWEVLGVPLKIVALQDPGNRKARLWESFAVDTTEDAELVIRVVTEALQDRPGTQFITDKGTPYMAKATAEALDDLEIEHAPQKEGTPTDKATQERSFGVVKQALQPLTDLSRRMGEAFPSLKRSDVAKAVGRLLLSTYLRVYEAASGPGGYPLSTETPGVLRLIIEEQRAKARAENRSARLLLRQIHEAYHFPGRVKGFIRTHRHHALEDIREAERRLRTQAVRFDDIRNHERYFAAILRQVAETNDERRANDRAYKLAAARQGE